MHFLSCRPCAWPPSRLELHVLQVPCFPAHGACQVHDGTHLLEMAVFATTVAVHHGTSSGITVEVRAYQPEHPTLAL